MSHLALIFREKKPGQRACDEKDAKGKVCVGHLKRWYTPSQEVVKELGNNLEIYRCERCRTLYRPVPEDKSSAGLKYEVRPVTLVGNPVHEEDR